MHISSLHLLAWFFAGLVLCGLAYQFLVFVGIAKFRRESSPHAGPVLTPPISILKPLRGVDPRMYEAFRSHCLQDYPDYEIIFGVADPDDPAVSEVERLRREFPARRIKLIVCPEQLGTNGKVSTLVQLLPVARHDLLVINDSDILVPSNYLHQIADRFCSGVKGSTTEEKTRRIGMVTTLYRAAAGSTLASRIESLTVATDFAGGVLAAYALEGRLTFGLGATLAVRRETLEAIGGLQPLLDYLADDYELGNRIARAGFDVVLTSIVVDTALPNSSFSEMFQHQLRWARTIRDRRLRGYIGLGVTHVVPWALLACVFAGFSGWSLALFAVAGFSRFAVAAALCNYALKDMRADLDIWLLPVRDVIALLIWIACFAGNQVFWRGETFRLRHGKLEKLE